MEHRMHSSLKRTSIYMATTALQMNPEPIAIECHRRKLQELTDVINHHSPRFRRIALHRLRNAADADDALQDAFLSALRHLDQFRGEAKMSTWFAAIVINSARMKLRQRLAPVQLALDLINGREDLTGADLVPDKRPGPEELYRKREIAERLAHATSRLSPALRMTFQLRDIRGLSIRETAHLMRVPVGTVKARLARARMRLKKMMADGRLRKKEARCGGRQQSPRSRPSRTCYAPADFSRRVFAYESSELI